MGWWLYVGGLGIPTALVVWGWNDKDSPPAQLAKAIGLSKLVNNFAYELSKPSHDKLLPDWSQVRLAMLVYSVFSDSNEFVVSCLSAFCSRPCHAYENYHVRWGTQQNMILRN